jgi:hypothetical protein
VVARAYLFPPLSSGGASLARACPGHQRPLVEPCVRFARIVCARTQNVRETRTCSLSGGRRPAPTGAPPPTRQVQGRQGVALPRPDVVRPSPASPLPSPRSSHIPCRITAFRLSCEVSETFHSGNSFGNRTPLPRLRLPSSCRGPLVFLGMRVVSHSVTSGPPITPPVLRPAPSAGSRNPVAPYAVVRYRVP